MNSQETEPIFDPHDEALSRLAAIVTASDDGIISKSLEGIIVDWNAGAEKIFGYTAAEAVGQPITILLPDDRLDEEDQLLARLQRGEKIDHFETQRRCKDGTIIDMSVTISPFKRPLRTARRRHEDRPRHHRRQARPA